MSNKPLTIGEKYGDDLSPLYDEPIPDPAFQQQRDEMVFARLKKSGLLPEQLRATPQEKAAYRKYLRDNE